MKPQGGGGRRLGAGYRRGGPPQAGYPITIIPPVLRNAYLDALKACDRGDNRPVVNLVSNMVVASALDHLRLLRSLGEG